MARGNQRDKAREKNQKAMAAIKGKNPMSGPKQAAEKESAAETMRRKQALADEKKAAAEAAEREAKMAKK